MTAHIDTFAKDNLPPRELWPEMAMPPELNYPDKLNCAQELLDKAVSSGWGERTLFFYKDSTWTYRQLQDYANRIANVLVEDMGFKPGNRVLLCGPNTPKLAACWFAVLKAGGICVTTMPLLRSAELSFIVNRARIKHALVDLAVEPEIENTRQQVPELKQVIYFNGADCSDSSDGALENAAANKSESFQTVLTDSDDVALIGFTSGTTGKAKATMHFHRDVMTICDSFPRSILKPSSEDVFIGTPPFGFTFGLGAVLLFPMRFGAASILCEKSAPEDVIKLIARHGATICFTSPTGYRAMAEYAKTYKLDSLRKCVSAGETLPSATFELWRKLTGIKIIDGIGATELLHIFISAAGDDIRPGSTGKAIPGYEAQVFSKDGQALPPGEVGLLAVRGPTGCRYLDDIERQKEYVRSGWNFTGDAYLMDKDGYFWFQARADDIILSSGYNISGIEVENVLLTNPLVKECGVVGVPDEERGHIVKAFVVLKDSSSASPQTAKSLQDFVKARIAPYKYPRAIEFVALLPRTESGKLQRFKLR